MDSLVKSYLLYNLPNFSGVAYDIVAKMYSPSLSPSSLTKAPWMKGGGVHLKKDLATLSQVYKVKSPFLLSP